MHIVRECKEHTHSDRLKVNISSGHLDGRVEKEMSVVIPMKRGDKATSKEVPNMLSLTKDICLERVELVKRGVGRRMGWTR